jgi:hypothetical protein
MKKNCVRIFLLAFAILFFLDVSKGRTVPVVLDFNTYPGGNWQLISSGGTSYVSGGILTIDAPADYHEFMLLSPYDEWHEYVDNSRGWVIEAKLKIDSTTAPQCGGGRGAVQIWANDYDILLIIGFSTDEICIAYPDLVKYAMDTTNDFHVYRIEAQFDNVKIYVDDNLRIEHTLTWPGGGSQILTFGDGVGGTKSLSYWDYFWYDVFSQIEVTIDIKPGSFPNCINVDGHGVIPVAILGSADFDVTQIDISTLNFAGTAVRIKGNDNPQCSVEDVSGDFSASLEGAPDGYPDLVCHFVDDPSFWEPGDGVATLDGLLLDGTPIQGTDTLCVVPAS